MTARLAGILAHEIVHLWFGDLVTPERWEDLWVSEGVATWLERKLSEERGEIPAPLQRAIGAYVERPAVASALLETVHYIGSRTIGPLTREGYARFVRSLLSRLRERPGFRRLEGLRPWLTWFAGRYGLDEDVLRRAREATAEFLREVREGRGKAALIPSAGIGSTSTWSARSPRPARIGGELGVHLLPTAPAVCGDATLRHLERLKTSRPRALSESLLKALLGASRRCTRFEKLHAESARRFLSARSAE